METIELQLCQMCQEDLEDAGYTIDDLETEWTVDRCSMCDETSPVRKVRLTKKRRKMGSL